MRGASSQLRALGLWLAAGGTALLVISLYDIYDVMGERWDRSEVLAHGRDAQARVVQATGIESVQIEWTDESGRQLKAESRAGKPFARSSAGTTVPIKYDPALSRAPVILSEVEERDQTDTFWLQSSLFVISGIAASCAAAAFSILRVRRMRAAASPK